MDILEKGLISRMEQLLLDAEMALDIEAVYP